MNPIGFALRHPITVMVLIAGIVLGSIFGLMRMQIDVFPNLNLPVIYVVQAYGGMDPAQMEGLLTNYYEYHFLYISGIHHVESRNIQSCALMKLYFHPGTDMAQAMAETIAYVNRSRSFMPPGRDVAAIREGTMPGEYDRYNMRRLVSINANLEGEDLGHLLDRLQRAIEKAGEPPRGVKVDIRGQAVPLRQMFQVLAVGLALAVIVILLLLTAYFQSFRLAVASSSTLPAVLAGVVIALSLTGATLNIQSFMGAIMARIRRAARVSVPVIDSRPSDVI